MFRLFIVVAWMFPVSWEEIIVKWQEDMRGNQGSTFHILRGPFQCSSNRTI